MVIIGIVVAGTIISLGATGRDSQLEQERDRLTALIAYARERGALLTLEYGIRCGQHGYRFVYYDNRTMQWQPETLDDTLRVRHLPSGLALQLAIEGRPGRAGRCGSAAAAEHAGGRNRRHRHRSVGNQRGRLCSWRPQARRRRAQHSERPRSAQRAYRQKTPPRSCCSPTAT